MASLCEAPIAGAQGEESVILERRQAERFRCNWYPTISYLARTDRLFSGRAVIRDVSRVGVGMISERYLEPGALLAIQLRSNENGFSDVLSARVAWSARQEDGSYFLGCHLARNLSNEEIDALLI